MAQLLPSGRLVGVSLKMYFTLAQTTEYISQVARLGPHAHLHNVTLFVIPDFVSLYPAQQILHNTDRDTDVILGAQDVAGEDKGAYTGEVSPVVLREVGVGIVVVGHAERRQHGESDEDVARKVKAVVANGMIPLICVGEARTSNIASKAVGLAVDEVTVQVKAALSLCADETDVIIAYEPVWAIGASHPAPADHVVMVAKTIRELVMSRRGTTKILYGGSAGPGTFAGLASAMDGLFLGRFAHDIGNLKQVITEMGR